VAGDLQPAAAAGAGLWAHGQSGLAVHTEATATLAMPVDAMRSRARLDDWPLLSRAILCAHGTDL